MWHLYVNYFSNFGFLLRITTKLEDLAKFVENVQVSVLYVSATLGPPQENAAQPLGGIRSFPRLPREGALRGGQGSSGPVGALFPAAQGEPLYRLR